MLVRVCDVPGLDLDLAAYNADFWQEFDRIGDVFWKLERIQAFREPGVPSWEAMNAGDWERSLSLLREGDVVPELVILGGQVMYEIRYGADCALSGARRIDDLAVIAACHQEVAGLYDIAEELHTYFDREIDPLPAPPKAAAP
jgi:hypothetical protein